MEFQSYDSLVLAELEKGKRIKCKVLLTALGEYEKRYEERHPDCIGWYEVFEVMDIDERTIEAKYPDEYGIEEIEKQEIRIKKIIKVYEANWEVIR